MQEMKRPASDSEGAKKAPKVDSGPLAPGPSRRVLSYSIETDPSEDPETTPPDYIISWGAVPEARPVAPVVEHHVRPATPASVTDYPSPLSWPSVNQEWPDYLYFRDPDEEDDEGQTSRWRADDDEAHTSPSRSPDQTRVGSNTGT